MGLETASGCSIFELTGGIHDHQRNAVFDWEGKTGSLADEFMIFGIVFQAGFGQRADQELKQFRVDLFFLRGRHWSVGPLAARRRLTALRRAGIWLIGFFVFVHQSMVPVWQDDPNATRAFAGRRAKQSTRLLKRPAGFPTAACGEFHFSERD